MKIMTLLGFLVLLTTSPMTKSFPGQRHAVRLPIPVYHPKPVAGSIFGLLALTVIAFRILSRPSPTIKPSTTNKPSQECPSGYTLNETKCGRFCYLIVNKNIATFENARAACKAEEADLLEPDECSFLFFRDLAIQSNEQDLDYWVGAFRIPPAVKYTSVRGKDLPDNFPFWGRDEPDRGTGACVQIESLSSYLLAHDECDEEKHYMCQTFM